MLPNTRVRKDQTANSMVRFFFRGGAIFLVRDFQGEERVGESERNEIRGLQGWWSVGPH